MPTGYTSIIEDHDDVTSSHIVDVSELPEITPESYSVDLATWREKRRP